MTQDQYTLLKAYVLQNRKKYDLDQIRQHALRNGYSHDIIHSVLMDIIKHDHKIKIITCALILTLVIGSVIGTVLVFTSFPITPIIEINETIINKCPLGYIGIYDGIKCI